VSFGFEGKGLEGKELVREGGRTFIGKEKANRGREERE